MHLRDEFGLVSLIQSSVGPRRSDRPRPTRPCPGPSRRRGRSSFRPDTRVRRGSSAMSTMVGTRNSEI